MNTFRGKRCGSEASLKLLGPFTLRFRPTMEALADVLSWLTSSCPCLRRQLSSTIVRLGNSHASVAFHDVDCEGFAT